MVPLAPQTSRNGKRFTVLTYNILADLYATQQAFPTSEPYALLWQYRRQLILQELELYNADIICLQEVQSTSFHEDLRPEMDKRGFDAVFKKKTQVRSIAVRVVCSAPTSDWFMWYCMQSSNRFWRNQILLLHYMMC